MKLLTKLKTILEAIKTLWNEPYYITRLEHDRTALERMRERYSYDYREIEADFLNELDERKEEIKESEYPTDTMLEIVDSHVPIYNFDLAICLANDLNLGYVDDTGLVEGCDDIFKAIHMSIYESLTIEGYNWMQENEIED